MSCLPVLYPSSQQVILLFELDGWSAMPWNKLSCPTDAQLPECSTLWNNICFPHLDPSAFVYYTKSLVQNSISYCEMRILKSKLHLALRSKCQCNWAPCLLSDYQAWKTLKSIPLNKEQSNHPALWVFFSSKSKTCFIKWGTGVEENSQDPTPNRKQPSLENGKRKNNFSEVTQQGNAWINKIHVSKYNPILQIIRS